MRAKTMSKRYVVRPFYFSFTYNFTYEFIY